MLTMLMIILGVVTVNAQGFMFFSVEEIKESMNETTVFTEGVSEKGISYVELNDDNFEWVLFLDGDIPIVYEAHLLSKSYEAFLWSISELDKIENDMIRQGDGHWIYLLGSGAINIQTKKYTYSPYPVIVYTYKYY